MGQGVSLGEASQELLAPKCGRVCKGMAKAFFVLQCPT